MQLSEQGLISERKQWEIAGYNLPQYDHKDMVSATKENPFWLHFGAGNIFRAFQANVVQELLNNGTLDRGLIAVGGHEEMDQLFAPHDNYTVLVTLKADGAVDKTIVGSIAETLTMDAGYNKHFKRLREIFTKDSLQIVSFTITEKGYSLAMGDGCYMPEVAEDMEKGPENPVSYMGKVTALLYARYQAGQKPIAMVSMDNCSHNGTKLYAAISSFARKWSENGQTDSGFLEYIENPEKVSFPWSMIDKITPRPDAAVERILEKDGIQDLKPIITEKNAYIAPFVNAEECEYLVIEDAFPNGRPKLEKGGIIFTERETVDKVEKMKVCTCLNPLHSALAIFGCILGYDLISEEMNDTDLRGLIIKMGYIEAMPVVVDPGVLNPKDFIDAVLNRRLPNPFMPDTPQRIATDTSQKLSVRFGETIKAYVDRDMDKDALILIPLVLAGYARYLKGIDDEGKMFEISSDPLLKELQAIIAPLEVREGVQKFDCLKNLYNRADIFGVDLYEVGLGKRIEGMVAELYAGYGAVRKTLHKYVSMR